VEGIQTGISTTNTPPATPVQIGWAGDGFPILYRFGPDENGNMKELMPSYALKYGNRSGDGITAPCGSYNGKYTNDYEYVEGAGDLDECNGVERTITLTTQQGSETFSYFYMVTATFPQIPRCVVGTPGVGFADLQEELLVELFKVDSNQDRPKLAATTPLEKESSNAIDNLDLQIMPNPTKGELFVSLNGSAEKNYQIAIFNGQGQLIQQPFLQELNRNGRITTSFSLADYPTGIFFLQLMEEGVVYTRKIIKQ